MSWGQELWDKYSELTGHSQAGIDFLEQSVGGFLKERAKVEADYAKSLRALIKRYMPKDPVGSGGGKTAAAAAATNSEEFTHIIGYKQMLTELGYQAGQHEVLSDSLSKEQYKAVSETVKRFREQRKRNMKESEKIASELRLAYKSMDAAKEKFRRAFEDQEKSFAVYNKANAEGSVTRNDVNKLQGIANKATQNCDAYKGKFASQLVKTNEFQSKYYRELLPQVLSGLQHLEQERVQTVKESLLRSVAKEKELQPIVCKCMEAAETALRAVDPADDTEIIVDRLKSGDVPPPEFKLDDMTDPQTMLTQEAVEKPTNLNLFPKKRELEKSIEEAERELQKKLKELKSLQTMVETLKKNPKFGDSKGCASEIGQLHVTIGELESALQVMRANLASVEDRLESLRDRSPMAGSPMLTLARARGGGNGSSGMTPRGSQSSGSLRSSNSHTMNTSPDSISEPPVYEGWDQDEDFDHDHANPPPPPPPPSQTQMLHTQQYDYGNNASPPPPPPPRCMALYQYPSQAGESMQETNIPMAQGEEFEVVEADSDGWTLVRRIHVDEEGYVPTSFIRMIPP